VRPLLIGLVLLATGCSTDGLVFVDDGTLQIDAPRAEQRLAQPVTLRWHLKTGHPVPAQYGVLIDLNPPKPGGVVDPEQREHLVLTTDTSIVLPTLNPRGTGNDVEVRTHEVTVVLMDADGRRIDERADYVRFVVDRP
jgi:hypothetical protein